MERRQEQLEGRFGEAAAAAMAATTTLWSLLHRLAQGCAGYLSLTLLNASGHYRLKAPAATSPHQDATVSSDYERQQEEKEQEVVEVQSRSMVFQKKTNVNQEVNGGGIKY